MSFRGQSLHRLEDERFLTGRARFIEDIDSTGAAWMHVVRSPHAHAAIERIDTAAARAVPGVLGIFTAADLADLGPLPCTVPVASVAPMIVPPRFALASDRHATSAIRWPSRRRDRRRGTRCGRTRGGRVPPAALGRRCGAALTPGAPLVWDDGNLSFRFQKGDPTRFARPWPRGSYRRTRADQQPPDYCAYRNPRGDRHGSNTARCICSPPSPACTLCATNSPACSACQPSN